MSGFISSSEYRRPGTRAGLRTVQTVLLVLMIIATAGPLLWMVKGALSTPSELAEHPLQLWPSHPLWGNFATAWNDLSFGRYMLNTVYIVLGIWAVQLIVSVTAGYALSVLRPRFGRAVYGAILATMFVPHTVSLVSLFLTVVNVPLIHVNLGNTYWAIWLPAGANAFNVLLAKNFFDDLPGEVFEAARIDGAGTLSIITRIVMPMSRPVLAVISLLSVMGSWKEFLWPLIVLTDPDKQPISVALANLSSQAPQDLVIASMIMATLPPIIVFLIFQRQIVSGLGFTGVKG
jgi:multiple sugar transport system permease protein